MKTILITGGSDGLGKALTEKLSKEHTVIVLARNEQAMQVLAEQTGCKWFVCDVKNAVQVAEVVQKIAETHGTIDVLVNNAGIVVNGELVDTSAEDIENVIATNTLGSIYMAKAVLAHMKPQRSGLIINVISQSGLTTRANRSIYNASKWALTGFTKALQQETSSYGVRVTGFYPGTIQTNLFAKAGIDMQGVALTTDDTAKAIEFMISLGDDVAIPELGIKHAEA